MGQEVDLEAHLIEDVVPTVEASLPARPDSLLSSPEAVHVRGRGKAHVAQAEGAIVLNAVTPPTAAEGQAGGEGLPSELAAALAAFKLQQDAAAGGTVAVSDSEAWGAACGPAVLAPRTAEELADVLLPPPPLGSKDPTACADTTIMLPTYREDDELASGLGGYLELDDVTLTRSLELMIVVDGHPGPPAADNSTLRTLKILLGIDAADHGSLFPGHFRVWRGYVNDIAYAAYVKLPCMARGKRQSQVLCFDLSAFRERVRGKTSIALVQQDADTRAPERSVRAMREMLLRRQDLFAVSPILECANNSWRRPLTMLGHTLELRACMIRHGFSLFQRTDVIAGPFSGFNWRFMKQLVDDFAVPVEPGTLTHLQWHLGEDGRVAQVACAKGFAVCQTQIEAYWNLPETVPDFFAQRRRWTNATMIGLLWVSFGIPGKMWNPRDPLRVVYSIYYLFQGTCAALFGLGLLVGCAWGILSERFSGDDDAATLTVVDAVVYSLWALMALAAVFSAGRRPEDIRLWLLALYTGLTCAAVAFFAAVVFREMGLHLTLVFVVLWFAPLFFLSHPSRWPLNLLSFAAGAVQVVCYPITVGVYSMSNLDMHTWGIRELETDGDEYGQLRGGGDAAAAAAAAVATERYTEAAATIESLLAAHPVVYDRNHYNLSAEQFASRVAVLRRKKWAAVVALLGSNFAIALACRYVETGVVYDEHGVTVNELWKLLIAAYVFVGALSLALGVAHTLITGPARTPCGRPPYDRDMYPPSVSVSRLPPRAAPAATAVRPAAVRPQHVPALGVGVAPPASSRARSHGGAAAVVHDSTAAAPLGDGDNTPPHTSSRIARESFF